MSGKRLDHDRQNELEPQRLSYAKKMIESFGYKISFESKTELRFYFKNCLVCFFPYSGWHTGRSIKDGRGLNNLLKQINEKNNKQE